MKRTQQRKLAQASKTNENDGFVVLSHTEAERNARREREYKAMQAKLTRINQSKRSGIVSLKGGASGLHGKGAVSNMAKANLNARTTYNDMHELYLKAIVDPFGTRGVRIPNIEPIPTSTFSTWRDLNLEMVTGDSSLRIVAPCHYAAEFAATGNSTFGTSPNEVLGETFLVPEGTWGHPFNGGTPPGDAQYPAPNQGTLGKGLVTGSVTADKFCVTGYVPALKAADVVDLFSHVRMVSAGVKCTYTGKTLDVSGRVAVAQLPPGIYLPTMATAAAPSRAMVPNETFDFEWDSVASLPGAQIFPAGVDFEIFLKPYSEQVEDWCPTKYVPTGISLMDDSSELGLDSCPPCTGFPDRFKGKMDAGAASATSFATSASRITLFNTLMYTSMNTPDNPYGSIVIIYEGCDSAGTINVQITANWEGVPESRSLSLAMPRRDVAPANTVEANSRVRSVAKNLPNAHVQGNSWYGRVWPLLKKAGEMGSKLILDAGGTRALLAKASSSLGVEIPDIVGDIAIGAEALLL